MKDNKEKLLQWLELQRPILQKTIDGFITDMGIRPFTTLDQSSKVFAYVSELEVYNRYTPSLVKEGVTLELFIEDLEKDVLFNAQYAEHSTSVVSNYLDEQLKISMAFLLRTAKKFLTKEEK